MSDQGETWYRHTLHYLRGIDPTLEILFEHAMLDAGYPKVAAGLALEAICADFLAGFHPSRKRVDEENG
jgi:hypothetical protein